MTDIVQDLHMLVQYETHRQNIYLTHDHTRGVVIKSRDLMLV